MSAHDTEKILNGPLKSSSAPPIKGKLSQVILVIAAILLVFAVLGYLIWGVAREGRSEARVGKGERALIRADVRKVANRKIKRNRDRIVTLTRVFEGSPGAPGAIGLGAQGEPGVGFAGPIGPIGFGTPGTNGVDGVDGAPGIDGIDGEDGAPGADGQDGANGADGADGAPGPPPLSLSFTNPAVPSTCTDPDGDLAYDCPPDP